MFGQQNNNPKPQSDAPEEITAGAVNDDGQPAGQSTSQPLVAGADSPSTVVHPEPPAADPPSDPLILDEPTEPSTAPPIKDDKPFSDPVAAAPSAPTPVPSPAPTPTPAPAPTEKEQISDIVSPAGGFPKTPNYQYPSVPKPIAGSPSPAAGSDDSDEELVEIKQKALGELSPLVDKLDLPAEDKFRTIMMMIQASDDPKLVEKAYEAAHSIEDEKARAQALLDIVNEINYFTAPHEDAPSL